MWTYRVKKPSELQIDKSKCIPRHNTIKLLKIKNKEKIKATKENDPLPRKKDNSNTTDFIRNHNGHKEEA